MSALKLPIAAYPTDRLADVNSGASFTLEAARACCWAAQLAYESDPRKIGTIAKNWGFSVQLFDRRVASPLPLTETKGLILASETTTILSFAGTDPLNFANCVSDFNWLPRSGD